MLVVLKGSQESTEEQVECKGEGFPDWAQLGWFDRRLGIGFAIEVETQTSEAL